MRHLAVDIGATGGKVYVGNITESTLEFEEVHRFDNRPIERNGRWVWNVDGLLDGVREGIAIADAAGEIQSIAVDTMGVDFGLIADGELIQQPYSYRDPTVSSTRPDLLETVSKRTVFERSGINHWNAKNSLWQYHYLSKHEPEVLEQAETMVNMPQVVSTLLGGRPCAEVTVASTTQMLDPRTQTWATELLDQLELPTELLAPIEQPGAKLGSLDVDVREPLSSDPELVLPASHDTAAAVAAMPLTDENRAFLSTGTVFITGVELDEPMISDAAFEIGASNELGAENTVRFLKNLNNGFFLIEECRHVWEQENKQYSYAELLSAAEDAEPFRSIIDADADVFETVGNMPKKVRSFCAQTDQPVPRNEGEMTRCILESLALKVAIQLEDIFRVAEVSSDVIHLGGGGVKNELFCQMVSEATGCPIVAGPSDASAVGNILVQARTYGSIESIDDGRELVRTELDLDRYEPMDHDAWLAARERLAALETAPVEDLG